MGDVFLPQRTQRVYAEDNSAIDSALADISKFFFAQFKSLLLTAYSLLRILD